MAKYRKGDLVGGEYKSDTILIRGVEASQKRYRVHHLNEKQVIIHDGTYTFDDVDRNFPDLLRRRDPRIDKLKKALRG